MKDSNSRRRPLLTLVFALVLLAVVCSGSEAFALASNNIPLDSQIYRYLEKLAGFGLIDGDINGLRPYSAAEVARLYLEAEARLKDASGEAPPLATEALQRLAELVPREIGARREPGTVPTFDYNLLSRARARYVFLDGRPRDYNRDVEDPGHQSAFGFIGGDLRPTENGFVHTSGTEGTALLENNEGVIYRRGSNADLRFDLEGHLAGKMSLLVEPLFVAGANDYDVDIQKLYLKIGGGGAELEVGRDANWFGPGYRGTTTLTNNARNFDLVKLSSPEPVDVKWIKQYLGQVKYAVIYSRFDGTGLGSTYRHPYFFGLKLAAKPRPWYEFGINFVRQFGGPGFKEKSTFSEIVLGGGENDHANTIAGFDLRFRIPWLRNTEVYGEYSGEDNAGGVWPIVESYVAGFYVPRLTSSGKDDLRFEYFRGSVMLYGDWKFPAGYVYHGMTPGHSQGTAAQDFFLRYSHWFSLRTNLAIEYFHTDRGSVGKLRGQPTEYLDGWRGYWNLPVFRDIELNVMYGCSLIRNFNLVRGETRLNNLFKLDLSYRY